MLAVWLIGAILALVTWRRHPGVSALLLLAVFILAADHVVSVGLHFLVPQMIADFGQERNLSGEQTQSRIMVVSRCISTASAVIAAAGYTLFLTAALRWRDSAGALSRND